MKKVINAVKKPERLLMYISRRGLLRWIPDALYLRMVFKLKFGYKLDLKNPKTFNEKLQWLKLFDRKPLYTTLVDKYAVRDYIAKTIGEEYLIPLIGVWDSFDDINFDDFPNQFVLKCNHDSSSVIICKDKTKFDIDKARKKLLHCLKRNGYNFGREWPYKNIKPRIIAEKYMTDSDDVDNLTDYKFFCFNGKADSVMLCLERNTGDTKFYFFDKNWNLRRYNIRGKNAPSDFTLPKPAGMDQMFELAEKLSTGLPYARIDLYYSNDKIYFGEITFFPASGFDTNILPETDLYFGNLINLEEIQDENSRISDKQKRK
jgi:hypothetical protein